MDRTGLWDALRERGVDADDSEIRAAVRVCLLQLDQINARSGSYAARRACEAMHAALDFALDHPDTGDMSRFEQQFDDGADGPTAPPS
jgi:hypothetical protein